MSELSLVAAGWASGLNAYLTVLLLGIAGRMDWATTPESLQQWWVIGAAGAAFAVEFVVDKVPLVDSTWDAVHTLIRPVVGGMAGAAIAGGDLGRPAAFAAAAGLALAGHATKSTTRLAINLSPEPATNVAASVAEDGVVAGLVVLAITHPRLAAAVTVVAAIAGLVLTVVLWRTARRALARLRGRGRPGRATDPN